MPSQAIATPCPSMAEARSMARATFSTAASRKAVGGTTERAWDVSTRDLVRSGEWRDGLKEGTWTEPVGGKVVVERTYHLDRLSGPARQRQ